MWKRGKRLSLLLEDSNQPPIGYETSFHFTTNTFLCFPARELAAASLVLFLFVRAVTELVQNCVRPLQYLLNRLELYTCARTRTNVEFGKATGLKISSHFSNNHMDKL